MRNHSPCPHGRYCAIRDRRGNVLGHKKREKMLSALGEAERDDSVDLRMLETSEEPSPT